MNKIIDLAKKAIGATENPSNSNKTGYGSWFGFDGVAWCGIFVSYIYHHAGYPLGNIGFLKGFAGCQTAVKHFKESGEITTNPVAGDIVFFDWNNDGRYDHCGIYVSGRQGLIFRTIEGNTSMGNDSNGGEVMERTRYFNKNYAIFVHPKVLDKGKEKDINLPKFLSQDLMGGQIYVDVPFREDVTEDFNKWLKDFNDAI